MPSVLASDQSNCCYIQSTAARLYVLYHGLVELESAPVSLVVISLRGRVLQQLFLLFLLSNMMKGRATGGRGIWLGGLLRPAN